MTISRLPGHRLRVPWSETYDVDGGTVSIDGERVLAPGDDDYDYWRALADGTDVPPHPGEASAP